MISDRFIKSRSAARSFRSQFLISSFARVHRRIGSSFARKSSAERPSGTRTKRRETSSRADWPQFAGGHRHKHVSHHARLHSGEWRRDYADDFVEWLSYFKVLPITFGSRPKRQFPISFTEDHRFTGARLSSSAALSRRPGGGLQCKRIEHPAGYPESRALFPWRRRSRR